MNLGEIDDLIEQQEIEELHELGLIRHIRQAYRLVNRIDNFERWNDMEFIERFRISKETVLHLTTLIENSIRHRTERNHAVCPLQQILLTLRFYSCGSFQIVLGDFGGIHRTTANQIIKRVTNALVELRQQYVNMPTTNEEIANIKEHFFAIARFPRVIGAIDCTHIRIQSPGGNEAEIFRNRKGFFSINVQAICDASYKIRNIVCNYPGSSHDSHIFENSRIRMMFENNEMGSSVLLGDSGYPLRSYLMTPFNNPVTEVEQLFNTCQIETRTIIERTFGIWKRRFPILSLGIRNKLPLVFDIIVATAVLHNIAVAQNEIQFEDIEIGENDINIENAEHVNNVRARQPFLDYFQTLL